MKPTSNPSKRNEVLGLVTLGTFLIMLALLIDPIGASPDTGLIDLGPVGTKVLLILPGLLLLVVGLFRSVKARR